MAVTTENSRDQYTATAGQTVFPYTFEIFTDNDVAVIQNSSLLSKGTNYTVSGVGNDSGGNITLLVGAAAGDIITIYRDMELVRLNDYQQSGDFLAEEVNDDFDRLWLAISQVYGRARLALRAKENDTVLNEVNTLLPSPSQRANRYISFDGSGDIQYLTIPGFGGVTKNVLYSSDYGVGSDGADYTTQMQAFIDAGDEKTTYIIDSTSYALSAPLLINNGFDKIIHHPSCVVDWLGAGYTSATSNALYQINLDASGARTSETILTTTNGAVSEGSETFTLNSVANLSAGDVIRINKHICRIVRIDGLNVITDRTLPIPTMPDASEVSRLDKPNIGSEFIGPSLIKFAPNQSTQVYGFGVIAALCYNVKISRMYGLHNASRLAELFYCADSTLEDVYQYEPTDVSGGGQSYAARISNGNDNLARKVRSYKGRHCVDITFSHRNKVRDSDDYLGVEASFLTHFNGCRYNKFINCNMWECAFGVYLSADNGDFENEWTDSFSYDSRAIYRPVETSYFRRLKIVTTNTSRDIIVPRGVPGTPSPSTCNMYDCELDLAAKAVNVDSDYTINMYGGSYKNTRIDGLFRGIASGTPGSPTTTGEAKFNFYGVQFPDISIGQGRSNKNAKLYFQDCTIKYSSQPFGEDCGDQKYIRCDIECTNASPTYLVTVGSQNNCELLGCTLRNVQLPFRYFAAYPADGTITFGDNKLLGTSTYAVANLLSNMNWTTAGYASLPIARKSDGTPANGTVAYWDSATASDEFKSVYNSGAWVDFFPSSASAYGGNITVSGGAITASSLPSGWAATYNSTGNYTITHNLGTTNYGFSATPSTDSRAIVSGNAITANSFVLRVGRPDGAGSNITIDQNVHFTVVLT